MKTLDEIRRLPLACGLFEAGYLEISALRYYSEVRKICEGNTCRGYGATWACPPAVGTLDECRERISRYTHMLLFNGKYALSDSFDFEGMQEASKAFKKSVDALEKAFGGQTEDYLILSNEGCGRCGVCTYPHAPCRFPRTLHHSIEGYGFIVSELAKAAGLHYVNGSDTVTYFGALLF